MSFELRKFVGPEILFGFDASELLGQYAMNIGASKIFIVTDENIKTFPWFSEILHSLDEVELPYQIFSNVTVNPKDFECAEGVKQFNESSAEVIVAIGGGSVIDCAKGIGILSSNDGKICEYEGVDEISYAIPPLICMPTTAGSSADISQFAIISETVNDYKMAIVSKTIIPDLSILDPKLTVTLPYDTTLFGALDALTHCIEAYVSNASSSLTDINAYEGVRLIITYLADLMNDLNNNELRAYIMDATIHAGLAFSNASLGLVHAMAHSVGGHYDLVHGEMNAILLEHVVKFNYDAAKEKYDVLAILFSETLEYEKEKSLYEYIRMFIDSISPNVKLSKRGVKTDVIHKMAEYVMKDPCMATNPKEVTINDVKRLYEQTI